MSRTRNLAHATNCYEPKEREILDALKFSGPLTRQRLSEITGRTINCVCGRVFRLKEIGAIEPCGVEINPHTNKPNELVRIKRMRRATA